MMKEPGDGLRLRDILRFTSLDVRMLWPDVHLLLVIGDSETSPGSDIFSLTRENRSTSAIALGEQLVTKDMLPGAMVVPISTKREDDLTTPVMVGRSQLADIYINHPTVSQRHAIIYPPQKEEDRWRIRDTSSTNGTMVGGVMLTPEAVHYLREMDDILFGALSCRFIDTAALAELLDWIKGLS